ncbi:MAG TPA: hypothetical protein VLQ45_02720 [Thermoanaerobaculia bacterium]|nr:hypothetical protein [Thermoanaerobaculia bacterium]
MLLVVLCLLFPAVSQARGLSGLAEAGGIESSVSSASLFAGTGSAFSEVWKSLLDLIGGVVGDGTPPPPEGENRGTIDPNGICGSNP